MIGRDRELCKVNTGYIIQAVLCLVAEIVWPQAGSWQPDNASKQSDLSDLLPNASFCWLCNANPSFPVCGRLQSIRRYRLQMTESLLYAIANPYNIMFGIVTLSSVVLSNFQIEEQNTMCNIRLPPTPSVLPRGNRCPLSTGHKSEPLTLRLVFGRILYILISLFHYS